MSEVHKMIEIDDAGSGSLIGGTGIGIIRKETEEYIFKVIPIEFFQPPHFSQKAYQTYVIDIVEETFKKLAVSKNEPIYVCRGYIFDALRKWLTLHNYSWESTKIVGLLQNKVESSFDDYVINLGLPKNFIKHARYAFGFHRLFKWVMADKDNRAHLCKTGWKSWNKWNNVSYQISESTACKEEFCLKCGQLIKTNDHIININYTTNKEWNVNLHRACYQLEIK